MSQDHEKLVAARAAAELVEDGMRIGLGTGSTVRHLVDALGERSLDIECVATSEATSRQAAELGLTVVDPDQGGRLDLTIDGADEIDPALNLTKGGGGAHVREKIVAHESERFVVIADSGKLVEQLGPFGTPLEILPWAPGRTVAGVEALGAQSVTVRDVRSDNNNLLADAHFGTIADPAGMAASLDAIPGMVGHGLFPGAWVERAIIGDDETAREIMNTADRSAAREEQS